MFGEPARQARERKLEGLDIDHETAASKWQSEQMDYDYSVAGMFALGEC
jgi:hypothetical protein